MDTDAWLVERDGVPAGHALLHDDGHGRLFAFGWVGPDHAGHGVGAALVAATERRTRELAATADPARIVLRNAVLRADRAAYELLASRGYVRAEEHLRMVADLACAPPAPTWPAGLVAADFDPGSDGPAVDACIVEAFSNAWSNQAQWREQKMADPRFDRRLWIVARAGGRGMRRRAVHAGHVRAWGSWTTLAVRPPWRRRGLGAALLLETFGRLWSRGERRVGLGVDGDNPGRAAPVRAFRHAARLDCGCLRAGSARLKLGRENRGPKPAAGVRPA